MSEVLSRIEKQIAFGDKHPDVASYLSEMLGVFARHQGKLPDDLEEVYQHVTQNCSWCKEEFNDLKELKDSFTH